MLTTRGTSQFFSYYPQVFPDLHEELYADVDHHCRRFQMSIYGRTFPSRRRSCVFTSRPVSPPGSTADGESSSQPVQRYKKIPSLDWSESAIIQRIRQQVEEIVRSRFDYVLVHIYESGEDYIGYHTDSEALKTTIVSVSFGATRKFRLRKIRDTKGWKHEYALKSGDVFVMWGPRRKGGLGCQQVYKHSVPRELRVTEPRINLTFRQWDADAK
jgi:hypothetical protein